MPTDKTVFHSRASQVAHYLREKILSGYWQERLPAERELARQLGVGRQSVRSALQELQNQGLITSRTTTGTRIVPNTETRNPHKPRVGLIVSHQIQLTSSRMVFLTEGLRRHLETQQVEMEIHKTQYLSGKQVSSHFKKLLQEFSYSCWALLTPTLAMQKWCRAHTIPSMVIGTGDEENTLPNASIDYYALAYHAVGQILRHGHRRIALILPKRENGEDVKSRLGFQAAIADSPHRNIVFTLESHNQTPSDVCRLANRLLAMSSRPTAWLICRHWHFVTVLTHLQSRGVRIPRDISLISRDSDDLYGSIIPEPTHYINNPELRVRQYAQLILRVINGQCKPRETIRLMPDFIPGNTLGLIE